MPKDAIMSLTPGSYAVPTTLEARLADPDFKEDFADMANSLKAELIALIKRDTQIHFPPPGKGTSGSFRNGWMTTMSISSALCTAFFSKSIQQ